MVILIPAYEPDIEIIRLVKELKQKCNYDIVVVDDGSGKKYSEIFDNVEKEGATVIKHLVNFGKGCALKTGIKYILDTEEKEGIVTADSDGQHLPGDIIKIANKVKENRNSIILGTRYFTGNIPKKSMFGNSITRNVFYFITGKKIRDTQTGLRGFSSDIFEWLLNIDGSRFEYEMNMLLDAERAGFDIREEKIETVYHEKHSTHFRTVEDSIRIYMPIIKFSISSISAAFIDYMLLFGFKLLFGSLLTAVVLARIISSSYNYFINKVFVFKSGQKNKISSSLIKYFTLVLIILALNYSLINLYYSIIGLNLVISKILTECSLFLLSFWMQRKFVFSSNNRVKIKIQNIINYVLRG